VAVGNSGYFAIHLIVNSNGRVTIRDNAHPWGGADVYMNDGRGVTMQGGEIRMTNSAIFGLFDLNTWNIVVPFLRGYGTFTRLGAGPNFTIHSEGQLRPGDAGGLSLDRTGALLMDNVQGFGTLSITGGDLVQTNTHDRTAMYFEFNGSAYDRINISGGTADIGGSCTFTSVSFTPQKGSGQVWDFVRATDITYTATDNMTTLMTSFGLVSPDDYTFGVVETGGGVKALRLQMSASSGTLVLIE